MRLDPTTTYSKPFNIPVPLFLNITANQLAKYKEQAMDPQNLTAVCISFLAQTHGQDRNCSKTFVDSPFVIMCENY